MDEIIFSKRANPNTEELRAFLEDVYDNLDPADHERFAPEQMQDLDDWFSVDDMFGYGSNGTLIEARKNDGELVGVVFVGKENPLSWPDGKKVKLFLLGTKPSERGKGIGTKLMAQAEEVAKAMGAEKIIVDTHVLMEADHHFYKQRGYTEMGVLKDYYANGDAIFFGKEVH